MERYIDPKIPYLYKIINHISDDYVIDPQGSIEETVLFECDKLYTVPEKLLPKGYYSRD